MPHYFPPPPLSAAAMAPLQLPHLPPPPADEAAAQQCGVLVHCLAGVSRSVTVTVAYLMQRLRLSLNDAYDLVKRKKADASPNFNFLGQLLDFERQLGLAEGGLGPGSPPGPQSPSPAPSPAAFFSDDDPGPSPHNLT